MPAPPEPPGVELSPYSLFLLRIRAGSPARSQAATAAAENAQPRTTSLVQAETSRFGAQGMWMGDCLISTHLPESSCLLQVEIASMTEEQ